MRSFATELSQPDEAVADKLPPASAEAVELELAARLVNAAVQPARDIVSGLNPDASPKRP